ncbi:ABC transporter ATP-binding protein [Lacrimispora sp. 210928-DFI.3.58]|uniref:ABC transporter ATP-binding protein n=1 Tax=Lacrimispora sp. 210928-DFI.3.58 TaxID=2883214 RepID=UPI001D076A61|nr:ABC transporter ATP-binding protein [Lacrimispora sp. 210928-DFI.3.58]MCB7320126.1 ABC transporter ATP-binding protein [Lacrimispora sp. 210928-DFI.3.58]
MDAIRMTGIVKCFGPVRANDGINFTVKRQEIHCLLGENGTGKSTLMNILFGLYHPDSGEIYINEKKAAISNPNDAYALGIGMVHQHFMLVNQLTVLENIILGKESGGLFLDRKKSQEKVEELVERFGFKIDLHEKVVNLSVGMKQRVEILKTLYRGADIIILDEPTAVLTPQEVEELFKILRHLKESGKTIIFITHKLNETMALSDRITVIRKGKVVFESNTCDTNEKELATQMVGRQVESIITEKGQKTGEVVLELKNVRLHERAGETVSLKVRAGEILGIAGVDGNGQQELEEMIIGNREVKEGTILMNNAPIEHMSVKDRKALGIGYIPSDRHKNAMVSSFSITENFLLGYQEAPEYCRNGFIDYKKLEQDAKKQVEVFEIKVAGVEQEIGQLSGGNQQKVILGREISHDPRFMLVAQPVRGLDIGAIERVHKTLLELKRQGKAILLISAELSEVMNLSDRIAVMYEGEVSAQFVNGEYTKEEIGLFMAGKKQEVKGNE